MNISITSKLIFNTANSFILFHDKNTNVENLIDNENNIKILKESIRKNDRFGSIKIVLLNFQTFYKEIFLINIDKDIIKANDLRKLVASAYRLFKKQPSGIIEINLDLKFENIENSLMLSSIIEGLYLSNYNFDKYLSSKILDFHSVNIILNEDNLLFGERILDEFSNLSESVLFARDLVNEPANIMTPTKLAEEVSKKSKDYKFKLEILEKADVEKLGMGAFLSVTSGSNESPKFLVMRYLNNDIDKKTIGLVGKGITFDTGGLCIKTSQNMLGMKLDMAGAAAVIGAICAVAKNDLPVNVIAVAAVCENAVSGNSSRPGDVIKSMKGTTIEIINTDAEGRLTLADAVYYTIKKENVDKIIDVATLTGAAIVALGHITTAVLSNNDDFYKTLEKASIIADEPIWRLPNNKEYKQYLRSDIADLANLNYDEGAGTILGGMFVEEFVEDKPWIHMDIAGTSDSKKEENYFSKGATGTAVRTLYNLLKLEFSL